MGKITSGDGSAFAPMRPWQVLHRTVFGAEHRGVRYVVDVVLFGDRAVLYADGTQMAQGNMACRFPVLGGCI